MRTASISLLTASRAALVPGALKGARIGVWFPWKGRSSQTDAVFETAFDVNLNPDAPNDLEGSNFKASPLVAGDRVYLATEEGDVVVAHPDETVEDGAMVEAK